MNCACQSIEQMGFDGTNVTEGSERLAEAIGDDSEAIGDDSEAVICATGFKPGWDLFALWKVSKFGACVIDIYAHLAFCSMFHICICTFFIFMPYM